MAFARINMALAADNMAMASHIMSFGSIIMALEQKSRSSSLKMNSHVSNHSRLFIVPNNLNRFFGDASINGFVEFKFATNCTVFLIQFVLITDIADEHLPIWI